MKFIIKLSIAILCFNSCTTSSSFVITKDNITVVKHRQHPFLIDHLKKIVVRKEKEVLFEIETYSDSGSGCNSYLFEEDTQFIIIECNGFRYNIEKNGGKIIKDRWTWMEPLPTKYIGTFLRDTGTIYQLQNTPPKELKEVYIFKDPG